MSAKPKTGAGKSGIYYLSSYERAILLEALEEAQGFIREDVQALAAKLQGKASPKPKEESKP